ncbi:MAG TPA: hypothetical protein VMF52_09940 [Steroidobacteraceae bacterium]|nr:hypothetical protein [Steroidobacteraceae bacterium]
MSAATLAALQAALADIYDLPATPDVADFLLTDRARLASFDARASDEQLIVAQDGDTVSLGLFIDAAVLERLAQRDPYRELTGGNLADYLTVAEGVSHFVYVAWNAGHDKPVTLLELELQAEVDKYVLAAWLLREQGAGRFPSELHRALFERARVDPAAAGGRAGMYRTASNYAGRFCRRIAAGFEHGARRISRELLADLRRFYRLGNARKLAFIERHA